MDKLIKENSNMIKKKVSVNTYTLMRQNIKDNFKMMQNKVKEN